MGDSEMIVYYIPEINELALYYRRTWRLETAHWIGIEWEEHIKRAERSGEIIYLGVL